MNYQIYQQFQQRISIKSSSHSDFKSFLNSHHTDRIHLPSAKLTCLIPYKLWQILYQIIKLPLFPPYLQSFPLLEGFLPLLMPQMSSLVKLQEGLLIPIKLIKNMRIISMIPLMNQYNLVEADRMLSIEYYKLNIQLHITHQFAYINIQNMQSEQEKDQIQKFALSYYIDIQASNFQHSDIFKSISKPWEVLPKIQVYLKQFFKKTPFKNQAKIIGDVWIATQNIIIGQNTVIQHGAVIKAPCIIGKNCQIRKGAYIRGNVIIGDRCVIGNSCQIKNSIIMNQSQVPHFNYVGDSLLGTKSHISGGAVISNLKLDDKNVTVKGTNNKNIDTGIRKFGAIIGDQAQIGCNCVLNPGSLIGKRSRIYPNVSFRGFIQSDRICKLKQQTEIIQISSFNGK